MALTWRYGALAADVGPEEGHHLHAEGVVSDGCVVVCQQPQRGLQLRGKPLTISATILSRLSYLHNYINDKKLIISFF